MYTKHHICSTFSNKHPVCLRFLREAPVMYPFLHHVGFFSSVIIETIFYYVLMKGASRWNISDFSIFLHNFFSYHENIQTNNVSGSLYSVFWQPQFFSTLSKKNNKSQSFSEFFSDNELIFLKHFLRWLVFDKLYFENTRGHTTWWQTHKTVWRIYQALNQKKANEGVFSSRRFFFDESEIIRLFSHCQLTIFSRKNPFFDTDF